ncbi:MAG: tRNA (N(6)-L-threonylcarbamoyladenosine(37)-C(2))-methylthiotransferase MtaB [Clostridia bacterium]|nr:tRNA (N(6)-L-threonylcarbamoyladenosine(37)-C(2))-methylthiotransferase MtaB [Clostridia bacterium]
MSKAVAFYTLGCKVNQYDSQAMLERFRAAGYQAVPFSAEADVYVINTCTVTGVGDKKSLQAARRIRREHPNSALVLCGCLAQRRGEALLAETGATLVLGIRNRGQIVTLLEDTLRLGTPRCVTEPLTADTPYEPLTIARNDEHTRAVMKIQEGCNNHCTYCIIPSVRGPIRSRSLADIALEARALAEAGYRELVLTGIHLTSYGRDLPGNTGLMDAIRTVHEVPGVERIRLGSLEPTLVTPAFMEALRTLPRLCPQFHLALQAGSDAVLRRMARRYNMRMYMEAVRLLREANPLCAITTDILTGFPGETEEEFRETCKAVRSIGFARIHVFPFSPREGTPAAAMPGQLTREEKERRARRLIAIGEETARAYRQQWIGRTDTVLVETEAEGFWTGYTPAYVRVFLPAGPAVQAGRLYKVLLTAPHQDGLLGEVINEKKEG